MLHHHWATLIYSGPLAARVSSGDFDPPFKSCLPACPVLDNDLLKVKGRSFTGRWFVCFFAHCLFRN
jgi:hypothetical protein